MLADRGHFAEWFRDARGKWIIKPGIRTVPGKYEKRRYKRSNRIEIVFGRLKDYRRVVTR